jgi:hypothetical protein
MTTLTLAEASYVFAARSHWEKHQTLLRQASSDWLEIKKVNLKKLLNAEIIEEMWRPHLGLCIRRGQKWHEVHDRLGPSYYVQALEVLKAVGALK